MSAPEPPVSDNELLYRRIPISQGWYAPVSSQVSPEAFRPNKDRDHTGISVDRARSLEHPEFRTAAEAAAGLNPKGYYIAILRVGDLRSHGIEVVARALPDNPGHAEIPSLTAANRRSDAAEECKRALARLTIRVEGPFIPPAHSDSP